MPTFAPVVTFGDLMFVVSLVFFAGVGWAQLAVVQRQILALARRAEKIEERVIGLTAELQRVIGAFEMHVRET